MIALEYDFSRCDYSVEETEPYLQEVIKSKYDLINAAQIFEALAVARRVHRTQLRANNIPYIIHPIRVALMLVKFDSRITSKVFMAALLHDTLEDTSLTSLEIEEKFGKYVTKLVQSVTRRHNTKHNAKDLEEKRQGKLQNWEEIMQDSHEVRAIKTFEDLDNMISWKTIPDGNSDKRKIPRWLKETQEMSLPLARATNMQAYHLMQQEYDFYAKQGYAYRRITI